MWKMSIFPGLSGKLFHVVSNTLEHPHLHLLTKLTNFNLKNYQESLKKLCFLTDLKPFLHYWTSPFPYFWASSPPSPSLHWNINVSSLTPVSSFSYLYYRVQWVDSWMPIRVTLVYWSTTTVDKSLIVKTNTQYVPLIFQPLSKAMHDEE